MHGTKSRGGTRGTSPPEFGVKDANANCPPRFCHASKFQASDCLHYKHYNAVKGLPTHDSDTEFTASQKHIFNVYQITTSGGNPTFSGEDTDRKYRSECTKTRHFK